MVAHFPGILRTQSVRQGRVADAAVLASRKPTFLTTLSLLARSLAFESVPTQTLKGADAFAMGRCFLKEVVNN